MAQRGVERLSPQGFLRGGHRKKERPGLASKSSKAVTFIESDGSIDQHCRAEPESLKLEANGETPSPNRRNRRISRQSLRSLGGQVAEGNAGHGDCINAATASLAVSATLQNPASHILAFLSLKVAIQRLATREGQAFVVTTQLKIGSALASSHAEKFAVPFGRLL